MTKKLEAAAGAAALLQRQYDGALATLSVELAGYPFNSVMPYALDRSGAPVIQIASIAQHTRNIEADPRVSLMAFERRADDLQVNARLTLIGEAEPCSDPDAGERYFRYFPDARGFEDTHDFVFYRLSIRRCRYIGGFGEIHWLAPEQVLRPNPFSAEQEAGMVEHMNADHADAVAAYCGMLGQPLAAGQTATLAGVDGQGCGIRVDQRVLRLTFSEPCTAPAAVRKQLAALAREARAGGAAA